jgi:hypothetical protein
MSDFIVGLDLGQAADYSALAIVEPIFAGDNISGPQDAARHQALWHYGCRGLKRWPLGTSYTAVVAETAALLDRPPLTRAALVIDATGIGRPVVDMFRKAGLAAKLVPVTITAGSRESVRDGFYHVPKRILIGTLRTLFRQRRLQFAQALAEAPALLRELHAHRVQVTSPRHETFSARRGAHDDLLLALTLAIWHGERGRARHMVGSH